MSLATQFDQLRAAMPVARRWAYFDHAAVAPLPEPTLRAIQAVAEDAATNGDVNWPAGAERLEQCRRRFATLLNAPSEEIALVRNTTEGINLVAEGLDWQPGDNVVAPADEFPSNLYPWMNLADRGVELRTVPAEPHDSLIDRLRAACDGHTRIVAVSWVGYASGYRHRVDQLATLAHEQGALLFLDAIQGLGVFPLDVTDCGVDFLAADGHKWMLGPEGAGVLYVRHEHLARLRPLGLGWNSVVHSYDFSRIELRPKPSAARYEGGSYNMLGFAGLEASLALLESIGQPALGARIVARADEARDRLRAAGASVPASWPSDHASGIVTFSWPNVDPLVARRRCQERGVVLSCRGGRLRISPHAYNNTDDIDRLVAALSATS